MSNALFPTKESIPTETHSKIGAIVAATVLVLWACSLIWLFSLNISQIPRILILVAVFLRAFLHTGLFITTHEAIHGTIISNNRQASDFIGSLTAYLYALLPYKTLAKNHRLHHRYPGSADDPDYYEPGQNNPLLWYMQFMKQYLQGRQTWVLLIGMTIIFYTLILGFKIPVANVLLFWVLPILLSSMQLFYFGIFLPHRRPQAGYKNRHRAESSNYSELWSFITCYHFGYHWEHHEYPDLPWYKLPLARQKVQ